MMNKFEFNECGVCINPNTPINYVDGINHYTITTCSTTLNNDVWVYGLSLHCHEQGFAFGGGLFMKDSYTTEDKAINHALRYVKDYLEHNIKLDKKYHPNSPFIRQANKMLADVKKILFNYMYVQPTLF